MVFSRLREANLCLGPHKCTLARSSVTFLGHHMSDLGLCPDPRLLDSITKIPIPTTVTQVRSFLSLVGYYRRVTNRQVQARKKVSIFLIRVFSVDSGTLRHTL